MPDYDTPYINRSIAVKVNGKYLYDRQDRIRTYRTKKDANQAALRKGGQVVEAIGYD